MKTARTHALTILLFASGVVAGCHDYTPPAAPPPQLPRGEVVGDHQSEGEARDAQTAAVVFREIIFDEAIPESDVEVAVEDGIAELTGEVDNLLAKRRATRIAESVKGVRSVSNRIAVDVPDAKDPVLEEDVESALTLDPAADAYELEIDARDGTITLKGTVDSWQERRHAERIAMSTRGVKSVDNRVVVTYPTARADFEIHHDVESRLRWDVLVDDAEIDVQVIDQVVTLRGKVGSAAEKQRAIENGWVMGVTRVEADDLTIDPWLSRTALRGNKYVPRSDADVRSAILDAAGYDPRVTAANLEESKVDHGHVTLTGDVRSLEAKRVAEHIARSTVGVIAVDNQLKIDSQPGTDADVSSAVNEALRLDPVTHPHDIGVVVSDGVVTLSGTVPLPVMRARAELAAMKTKGVQNVINDIEVEDDDGGYVFWSWVLHDQPLMRDWGQYADPVPTTDPDDALETAIEHQLLYEPFASAWQVQVDVKGGVATLTGTVDSLHEVYVAEANARQAGAVEVVNRLKVGH